MKPIKNAPASMDRRQFSLGQALYSAFFSQAVYVDVAKRWPGLCLRYFLLLLCVATLPMGLRFEWVAHQYYKEHVFEPMQHLPPVLIQNGQVEFEHMMPYHVMNKAQELVLVVDTTGMTTRVDHRAEPELTWLLTRNALYFSPPDLRITPQFTVSFKNSQHAEVFHPDMSGEILAGEIVDSLASKLLIYGGVVLVYPCAIAVFFGFFAVLLAAFGWAAQFYVRVIFRYKMSYQAIYRLLIFSLTPSFCMFFILAALGIVFPKSGLFYSILYALYFNLGVLAVRRVDRALVFA